jgi:hypothetical protein
MFDFGVLIVVDVFLLVSSYILVYLSAMKLRKKIPREEYKFRIPGGPVFMKIICIVPICVAVISFLINGSDYFIGGMIGIISGPVIYFIWRRRFGGLSKKDPEAFPVNKKTGLAMGDTKRLAILFGLLAAIGVAGCFFLPWYEADWSYEQLLPWWSADIQEGIETDYDMSWFASQEALFGAIRLITIICAGLAVIFGFVSRAIEPKKAA